MTSDVFQLSVRSDPDVQIVIYDAAGLKQLMGVRHVAAAMPRGLYRVHLDRCGFVCEHVIRHESSEDRVFDGPLLESPAPIEIARASHHHAQLAQRLSRNDHASSPPLGRGGAHDARLFVFVRSVARGARTVTVPSEPISIHEVTGRQLAALATDNSDHSSDPETGYLALSCRMAPGTYRLRVGRTRRDLAITIPAKRAAHVFLADHGSISLRTARVYLPRVDDAFDARGQIARAMESVLWVLRQARGDVPLIADELLHLIDRDLSFGIACAHLARRRQDQTEFDQIMRVLTEHAPEIPDVVILECTREGADGTTLPPSGLAPPLFRASLALALEHPTRVTSTNEFVQAAKGGHDDSVWCTWSPRWWDERWIEPTIERLQNHHDRDPAAVQGIARSMRIPAEVVETALRRLDAGLPRIAGRPVSIEQISVSGYVLGEIASRGSGSTVALARRDEDDREVAIKVIPISSREAAERIAREISAAARLRHPHLVRFDRCGMLPDGAGLWIEMEPCRESLFDRLAALGGPMVPDGACDLVLQALDALGYLHAEGVVHGHINPGNLLIRDNGTIALGLPAFTRGEDDDDAATDDNSDVVRFMSPEVVLDRTVASTASDVWSMAATLYFLLTLELPRERYTDQGERDAVRQNDIVPLARHRADLPDLVVACVERALSAVPARFHDANEFRAALARELRASRAASQATELHDELVRKDPAFAITIRNVFLRMSALVGGEVAGRRVLRDELAFGDPAEDRRVDEVLQRFQNKGLITLRVETIGNGSARAFAEPAHDELLRGWSQIRHRFDEFDTVPETRGLIPVVGDAVRSWQAGGRATSLLWSDRRAKSADMIRRDRRFVYTPIEADFVRRSRRKRRLLRVGLPAGLSALVAVALGFTGCVYWQREAAIDDAAAAATARAEVQQQLARSLQESGRQHLLDGRPLQALPYLVAAGRIGEVGPALRMLFHAASRSLSLVAPLEHRDTVRRATFSPDGSRIVTASNDGTARVWDTATGTQIASLKGKAAVVSAHEAAVVSAAFSPDGKRIVTASEDQTAQIWDAATGKPLFPPLTHEQRVQSARGVEKSVGYFVQSAVFSADGQRVATASLDHTARIWDATNGALEHTLKHRDAVWRAEFSTDGKHIVTASLDGTARIWNARTGALEHTLKHSDGVTGAAFDSTASQDGTARIWDAATGKAMTRPRELVGAVWSAEFSADGMRVVTASQDGTARIWNAKTGALEHTLKHSDGVTGAAFDPAGKYVVTASYDSTARVWDAASGEPVAPVLQHQGSVTSAMFSPDGTRIVTASSDAMARIWDTRTGRLIAPPFEHTGPVTSAMFSPSGTRVVTASFDRTARVWGTTGDRPPVVLGLDGVVKQAAISSDGARIVTSSSDKIARIWDTATGQPLAQLVHRVVAVAAAFSPDGRRIVTTSDRTAQIWDATTGRLLTSSLDHPGRVTSAAFSPDGAWVITASAGGTSHSDDTLHIWDATTGKRIPLELEYPTRIVSAGLSRDRTRLITLNQDRTARVWDVATGKAITPPFDQGGVTSAAFSPNGKLVVTASEDWTARIWDAATGRLVAPPLEHREGVVCASFSPDGARIITASEDRTARVWDAMTGKQLTPPLRHDAPIVNAAFSADGARVITVDSHAVRTWDVSLDPRSLQEWANVADQSPYVLEDGVLMLRSLVLRVGMAGPLRGSPPS